jgi:cyclohexadieny/prephenate dehydrogenase
VTTSETWSPMAVLGVGYMGGSLALAVRRAQPGTRVVGYEVDGEAAAVARRRGIVDELAARASEAVRGARLVVLSGPVRSLGPLAAAVADEVPPDALVIDIGSVKAPVVAAVEATALAGRFVGCHPLAGTEASGPGAADETLYQGKPCFLCPGPRASSEAVARARRFWEGLGCRVFTLGADEHDVIMAAGSHMPHVGAFALAASLLPKADLLSSRGPSAYPPTSLRDSTRVAASSPTVWRDILLENRTHLLPLVAQLQESVDELRSALERNDADALHAILAQGQAFRRRVFP